MAVSGGLPKSDSAPFSGKQKRRRLFCKDSAFSFRYEIIVQPIRGLLVSHLRWREGAGMGRYIPARHISPDIIIMLSTCLEDTKKMPHSPL
ncbi:hypothetical protein AusDCA_1486 [Desulfitobacterium sp. AusDCA]